MYSEKREKKGPSLTFRAISHNSSKLFSMKSFQLMAYTSLVNM